MSILDSIVSGAFGLGSTALSNSQQYKYQSRLNAQQYGYNSALQEQQAALNQQAAVSDYERQLDYWNRQNEYNLPSAEVQRLKEAGLSVGLMYSGGDAAGTSASASAPTQSGTSLPGSSAGQAVTQPYDFDFVARALDLRNKQLQNEALEVQIPRVEAETKNLDTVSSMNEVLKRRNDIQYEMDKIDSEFKDWNLSNLKTMSNAEVASRRNQLELQLLEIANLGYITKQNELGARFQSDTYDVSVAIQEMGYKEQAVKIISALAQVDAVRKGIDLTDAQIRELEQQIEYDPLIWESNIALQESITEGNKFQLELNRNTQNWQELEKKYNSKMARRSYRYMPFDSAVNWFQKISTAAGGFMYLKGR